MAQPPTPDIPAAPRPHRRIRRAALLHGAALLFYALTAFLILYPQVFHHRTHGAGYDYFFPHWTFWWTRHALTTEGLSVYSSDFVMFPYETSYAYNALTVFWFPAWAALEPLIGTLSAVTLIIFAACVLNGYALFALLRDEAAPAGVALLGGLALQAFPILRYFYYNTHINLMDWFWLPLHLLVWKRLAAAVDAARWRAVGAWSVLLGTLLYGLVLTDLQFPIFLAFLLVPYGLLTLWQARDGRRRAALIVAGAFSNALALALLWIAGPLRALLEWDGDLVPSPVEERPTIDFPADFLRVADTWWDWATPSLGAFVSGATLLTVLALLARGLTRRRVFWLLVMLPPLVMALGPTLDLGRGVTIPLPFRLLYDVTGGNFRMPWRLAPAFVIALALLAAHTWRGALPRRVGRRAALFGALTLLLLADMRLFVGGPLWEIVPERAQYAAIGAEQGPGYDELVVVEVPTGAGTGEVLLGDPLAIAFQYYGITHGKRMVNGFISRAPVDRFYYIHTDDPMLSWLGQRRPLEPERVRQQLANRSADWPIGYIVLHQDYIRANGAAPLEITGYFNALPKLLCPPVVEASTVFYRTTAHPDGCDPRTPPATTPGVYRIDVGASGDERYLGWGWHYEETVAGLTLRWAGAQPPVTPPDDAAPSAQFYADLPPGAYTVTVAMQAFHEPRTVRLLANGTPLGDPVRVEVDSLETYTFTLPEAIVGAGQHLTLALAFDGGQVPAEIGASADTRRLAVAVDWIEFRTES